jgi:hypothetical protein
MPLRGGMPPRQRPRSRAQTIIVLAVVSLAPVLFIGGGLYVLSAKEWGTTARVTITQCQGAGRSEVCSGMMVDGDLLHGGSVRTVDVDDATSDDIGKTIGVRIRDGHVFTTSLRLPIVMLTAGTLLALLALYGLLRTYVWKPRTPKR